MRNSFGIIVLFGLASVANGQHPLRHPTDAIEMRFARSQPVVNYVLHVDSSELTGWSAHLAETPLFDIGFCCHQPRFRNARHGDPFFLRLAV
jgi:hypothetical protein